MALDFEKLKEKCQNKTLLGVGPVTRNTVDAVINIANLNKIPMQLIPSRRQVECAKFGGGYVYDTETFASYVKAKDKNDCIILARDHGGPYQGAGEEQLKESEAIGRCMFSYWKDIENNFDILHLDPALTPNSDFLVAQADVKIMLEMCEEQARKLNKTVYYEVGTDGHGKTPSNLTEMKKLVELLKEEKDFDKIKFLVANTGTCVKERCNVGSLHVNETLEFIKLCNENGLMLKEHNNDYNSVKTLTMHRKLGVHSSNIAPEYGVEETKELLRLLKVYDLHNEHDDFVKLAYESKKWTKWMINGEHPDKEYLATICGHYIMETPEVKEIKMSLDAFTTFPIDQILTNRVERVIYSQLGAFGWF
jgi:hypothetical protein